MNTNHTLFTRLEAFLYSRKFIFLVVIAGTIPMIMHSHQLFFQISPFDGNVLWKNAYALFYAVSFDLTILVFTIHYIKRKPELYAAFSFIINLLYYNPFDFIPVDWIIAFTKVFIAAVLAFTSYSYSELLVQKMSENRQQKAQIEVNSPANQAGKHICKQCDKSFPSVKGLNGHMKVHRNTIGL